MQRPTHREWLSFWLGVLAAGAVLLSVSCGPTPRPQVDPEYAELMTQDRLSFALHEVTLGLDGLSRTHLALHSQGRLTDDESLAFSTSLVYVVKVVRAAVEALNEGGSSPQVRQAALDRAIAELRVLITGQIETLDDPAARASLLATATWLDVFLAVLRLEVMPS